MKRFSISASSSPSIAVSPSTRAPELILYQNGLSIDGSNVIAGRRSENGFAVEAIPVFDPTRFNAGTTEIELFDMAGERRGTITDRLAFAANSDVSQAALFLPDALTVSEGSATRIITVDGSATSRFLITLNGPSPSLDVWRRLGSNFRRDVQMWPKTSGASLGFMTPEDIGKLVWTSSPVLSPDGARVVYVVHRVDVHDNRYRTRIWVAATDGLTAPAPLTSGEKNDSSPTWSPDASRLAFASQRGDEKEGESTLHVLPMGGPGETATLAQSKESIESIEWSPDGRWLAYLTRTRDARYEEEDPRKQSPRKIDTFFTRLDGEGWVFDRPSHLYVVAADASVDARNLTPGPHEHFAPSWFPDSSALAVAAHRHDGWDRDLAVDIYRVPLDGSEVKALTAQTGDYGHPSVSPDGQQVTFLGHDDAHTSPQNSHVCMVAASGGSHRRLTESIDRTWRPYPATYAPVWIDEMRMVASVEDRGNVHLYIVAPDREPELLVGGERVIAGFDAKNGVVAFCAAEPGHPDEVTVLIDGVERRLTTHTAGFTDVVATARVERFTAPTSGRSESDDEHEIDGWIFLPRDFDATKSYPTLLNIHGGPFAQYSNTFFDEAQMQAGAGFVVILSNPRGGSGRSEAWAQAVASSKHPKITGGTGWGSIDYDDVMAVMDTALEKYPFIDGERLGVLGGSYGGYLTTWAVSHTNRFKAACSERSANNLLTLEYASDAAAAFWTHFGPTHLEDPEEYVRQSPITYVRDIETPMLIIHSEDDLRCPMEQAEQLFVALRMLDKEVKFYRFPGESHGLTRNGSPLHRKQRVEIILEFFRQHLI
jgi:dipeptidyl aminopeptidase/acylaminoacyl peptidase